LIGVLFNAGNPDHRHVERPHQASSQELPASAPFSQGKWSNATSNARMSHTLRPSMRRGPGIRPSFTKRSNTVADTPQYIAASSRESPRRGIGLVCDSAAVITPPERSLSLTAPLPAYLRPPRLRPHQFVICGNYEQLKFGQGEFLWQSRPGSWSHQLK
jgi:hypothetical protein